MWVNLTFNLSSDPEGRIEGSPTGSQRAFSKRTGSARTLIRQIEPPGANPLRGMLVRGAGQAFGPDALVDGLGEGTVFDHPRGFTGVFFQPFASAGGLDAAVQQP